ncbi:MAG: rRNA large subunit methyltransferase I, partial [Lachnospiraceae bacterium]|nr:rRNA large subunit methyltransferase I [Lachnospiraceae bacterium]
MINNTVVTLRKGEGRALKAGGAWIYDNEIESITGTFKNGDIVRVHDFDGFPLGAGFINQNSKIRIRMLTRSKDPVVDGEFLKARVKAAWDYRKAVMAREDLNCCRVIFGEADFLPGLVIDKYSDVLVVECLALGM